jgi:hypothetical protein
VMVGQRKGGVRLSVWELGPSWINRREGIDEVEGRNQRWHLGEAPDAVESSVVSVGNLAQVHVELFARRCRSGGSCQLAPVCRISGGIVGGLERPVEIEQNGSTVRDMFGVSRLRYHRHDGPRHGFGRGRLLGWSNGHCEGFTVRHAPDGFSCGRCRN